MNIFTGNLNYKTSEEDLRQLFSECGTVSSVKVIKDMNGQSRGFGFVEMPENNEAIEACKKLNGTEFMEHTIEVNEARPKPASSGRGGGGYGGNRGGGGDRRDFKKRY